MKPEETHLFLRMVYFVLLRKPFHNNLARMSAVDGVQYNDYKIRLNKLISKSERVLLCIKKNDDCLFKFGKEIIFKKTNKSQNRIGKANFDCPGVQVLSRAMHRERELKYRISSIERRRSRLTVLVKQSGIGQFIVFFLFFFVCGCGCVWMVTIGGGRFKMAGLRKSRVRHSPPRESPRVPKYVF